MLRVRLIGELALEVDGSGIPPPPSRRARSLLAWLALHPGLHPRGELAARFWPNMLDASARTNLRSALMTLRNELGPEAGAHLVTTRDAIGFPRDGEVRVDAVELAALHAAGDCERAVELGEGELLPGLDDDWVYAARDEHRDLLMAAYARLAEGAEEKGDVAAAARWTRQLAAHDPLSEDAHRELIRRLAAAGDRAAALATFEQLRERLARELHVAPSAQTRVLVEVIRREGASAAVASEAEPATSAELDRVEPLPAALAPRRGPPFVGRADLLQRLRATWEQVGPGAPRLWLIAGEPGIGKTRLAAELASSVHNAGGRVLYGRAYPEPLAPYQPFAEALGFARFADLVGEAESDRYVLFDAVASQLARPPGALLVIDDLHWADRPALLLLQHVLRSSQPNPLLIVATYRTAEVDAGHPLAEMLGDLRREHPFERVVLDGLAPDELGGLVAGMTGSRGAKGFLAALHDETEGNPFFVEEVLRHLAESGSVEERMTGGALGRIGVPEGVKDVVGRRLARLGEHGNHALAIAAVVGRRFGVDVLERLSGLDEDALIAALDDALAADLIADEPGTPGRFTFKHALVRETVYDALSQTRRMRLHKRVGEALAAIHGRDLDPHLGELAHHFVLAAVPGDAEEAVRYATAAGDRALEQLAYEDAARHYEAALTCVELTEAASDFQRCDLLLALGSTEARAGAGIRARAHFEQAAELAERIESPPRLALAALGYGADVLGGLWWLSVGLTDERMVNLLERALAALPPDGPLRARVIAQRAMQHYWTSERERGTEISADAVAMARGAGDPATLLYTLAARHAAMWGPDAVREQLAVADEVVGLAERCGDRERGLVGLGWRITDLLVLGERAALDEAVETCVSWAESTRQRAHRWYANHSLATLAMVDGRYARVEELVSKALSFNPQVHDESVSQSWAIQMYGLRSEQARLDELEEVLGAAVELYTIVPAWRGALAWLYAETGRRDECRAEFETLAERDFEGIPRDGNWLTSVAFAARTCAWLGDGARAAVLHELLSPYARLNAVTGLGILYLGSVELYLGQLAATAERFDEAERHFDAARAMHEQMRSPPLRAHTDHQHARMLLTRARPEDRVRASELLDRAAASSEALGMTRLSREIEDLAGGREPSVTK
jgi:DNA-binding SARP family transcriptional activator/tetratricopeptide (TPR) repeat protein